MLILTRREGESIRINDDISVMLLRIKKGQISLGIDAPLDVIVHREEVYERIHEGVNRLHDEMTLSRSVTNLRG